MTNSIRHFASKRAAFFLVVGVLIALGGGPAAGQEASGEAPERSSERPNVLFIAVDDLKPTIGAYGDPHAKTPNMDRLAAQGTVFMNAHAQQAVCAPSRASLLTGYRPDQTRVWDLNTQFRAALPNVVTLPQRFKQNGYRTIGMGKIFDPRSAGGRQDMDRVSWSEPFINVRAPSANTYKYRNEEVVEMVKRRREELGDIEGGWSEQIEAIFGDDGRPPTDRAEVPDDAYEDGKMAQMATERIQSFSKTEKPFFLAVGFRKPHLPFNAPEKYWQKYDPQELPLPEVTEPPKGAPDYAPQPGWELRNYDVPDEGPIPTSQKRTLIHGYYACTSYIDAQVGKLLDTLEETGVAENTIIVLWGDHGWHLGDHSIWAKHTNYEQATRSPLIISAPEVDQNGPQKPDAPVELLDIYPTLVDLAGLPSDPAIHGKSLRPLLQDPSASVKEAAVSQYHRNADGRDLMGYAYRTERYRLVQWRDTDYRDGDFDGEVVATELYDYKADPLETVNLADDPEYVDTLDRLQSLASEIHARHHNPQE